MNSLDRILRGEGALNRKSFVTYGVALSILKQALDIVLALSVFKREGLVFNYWFPLGRWVSLRSLSTADVTFLLVMVAEAVPFIWIGVCLTLARLRDAALPAWLVLFFFVPFLNVLFFVFLCCTPTAPLPAVRAASRYGPSPRTERLLDRVIPSSGAGSALAGALITLAGGGLLALFSINLLSFYGWGLFTGIPFAMGFISVLIYGYHAPRTLRSCLGVACLSPLLLGLAMLAYAIEGLICLLMAAPLSLLLAALGGALAHALLLWRHTPAATPAIMGLVLLALPLGMTLERRAALDPPVFQVTTAIDVDAPPEAVWPNVVAFAELPPPAEFLFRAGVAYPMRAEIDGTGPGAVRRCVFSTGAFIEPIQVWDAPRLLKFSVEQNPAPLEEWTPYERITPPHLRGFLVSRGGQFHLVPLPGGRTRLEGTTWYRHSMWPAAYWRLWSDHIIHEIHLRVLRYIAARSVAP
jgi:uncharacterized membrane protein YhaH (DUF805 family)